MLLLAMCDPNDQGAPPRSPLEVAIRRDEAPLVELPVATSSRPPITRTRTGTAAYSSRIKRCAYVRPDPIGVWGEPSRNRVFAIGGTSRAKV